MRNIKMVSFLFLSIIFIIVGIKYSFYEAGVSPDNIYRERTKISNFNCIDNTKSSDSLDINFIGINKIIFVQVVVYCEELNSIFNENDEVDLWLEKHENEDFINLWGLAINGEKIIWPKAGLKPRTAVNFFSVLLIFWGIWLGKKFLELYKLKNIGIKNN